MQCFPDSKGASGFIQRLFGEDHRCAWYALRYGIDENENGELDREEWEPNFAVDVHSGKPVWPHMVGLSEQRYAKAFRDLNDIARIRIAYPIARNLLRIFRDGTLDEVDEDYLPRSQDGDINSEIKAFHYRDSEFSDWLTHKAGLEFGPNADSAEIVEYRWSRFSRPSESIMFSPEILCAARYVYNHHQAAIATFISDASGPEEDIFPDPTGSSPPLPDQTGGSSPSALKCPDSIRFKEAALPIPRDLNVAFGRTRVTLDLEIETQVAMGVRQLGLITAVGVVRDLYDFSFAAPGVASVAAPIQIANGQAREQGRIYLNEFEFRTTWIGIPPWENCPPPEGCPSWEDCP